MSLKEKTVADIVDATRPPNAPFVHIVGETEQRATLETFQKELRKEGVMSYFLPSQSSKELNLKVDLEVDDQLSETDWQYNHYYHFLELDFVQDVLQIKCGVHGTSRPVADTPHLVRVVEAITMRLRAQWKRKQKRMKIHDLHVRAIELQIMALATRLDLSCRFERLHTQLWIYLFDSPIESGVQAYVPLDEPPHEHIAKFEKEAEKLYQRLEKEARQRAARKIRNSAKRKNQ